MKDIQKIFKKVKKILKSMKIVTFYISDNDKK